VIDQEKVVWMFGTRRSGSTWLGFMLRDLPGGHKWGEPLVGELVGDFHERFADRQSPNHIFSPQYRDAWLGSIRHLVCSGAEARFPALAQDGHFVVIRDPAGTIGAPLLCEALPKSRLLVLVRDPRDIVASMADAHQDDATWMRRKAERRGRAKRREGAHLAKKDPVKFARTRSERVALEFEKAGEAYAAHTGPKTIVRYEDVRFNTAEELARICSELEIETDPQTIEAVVEEHSWERVPEEEKGSGKFHRKASPGSYREDLSAQQIKVIERVASAALDTYYNGWRTAA
jgi:Sulfotransferase domain